MVTGTEKRLPSRTKEILLFGVSTAILAALIYISGPEKFVEAVSDARLIYLVPAVILGTSSLLVWSFTWYRVFQRTGIKAGFGDSVKLQLAGGFLNHITPFGQAGGEPFMAYIISSNTDASYEKSLSSVLSADILNILPPFTFVFGGAIYILFFHSITSIVIQAVYASIIVLLFGGGIVYLLWFEAGKIEGALLKTAEKLSTKTGRGENLVERLEKRLEKFEDSIGKMGEDPVYLVKTIIAIHLGFILEVGALALVMYSLGFSPLLSYLYFILPLADLANTSPTPGGSGTYEFAMAALIVAVSETVTGFAGGAIALHTALLIGILYRITTYWPGLLLGYISLNMVQNGK
ncbi:MAG: lysylphosphatidylglycerol synthase transmembrane domain-containing protein [Candidatus Nanohalobium sp.]